MAASEWPNSSVAGLTGSGWSTLSNAQWLVNRRQIIFQAPKRKWRNILCRTGQCDIIWRIMPIITIQSNNIWKLLQFDLIAWVTPRTVTRGAHGGRRRPKIILSAPRKMCWTEYPPIEHSLKNLGPSQKTLRSTWCPKLVTGRVISYVCKWL